jgi:hypothetical protein
MTTWPLHRFSIGYWLPHLIVQSLIGHLTGELVWRHPLAALLVGVAALLLIVLNRRFWRATR